MKNKLLKFGGLLALGGFFVFLGFLYFDISAGKVDSSSGFFVSGLFIHIAVIISLALLALVVDESGIIKKNPDLSKPLKSALFIAMISTTLFMAVALGTVEYQSKMIKISNLDTKSLCHVDNEAAYFEGLKNGAASKRISNNKEEVLVSFVVEGEEREKAFLKTDYGVVNLCFWDFGGEDIYLREVTVKTPFGTSVHSGDLFIKTTGRDLVTSENSQKGDMK